jgi:perosamine synthetase
VRQKLAEKGIGTRPFFYPIHLQPVLKKKGLFKNESCPVAERLYKSGLYVPSGLALKEEQLIRVADNINELLTN